MKKISIFGGLHKIEEMNEIYHSKSILLVTGKKSFIKSGAKEILEKKLKNEKVVNFQILKNDPDLDSVFEGLKIAKKNKINVIIAVGGGSVIDTAKLIKALYNYSDKAKDLIKGKVKFINNYIKIIAIPTTAGSGSEATQFAVCYINKEKYSVSSKYLLPNATILDGSLIKSNTDYQQNCSLLDSMAQAIESFWAKNRNLKSINYSKKALKILHGNFYNPKKNLRNDNFFQDLIIAANYSGMAINISRTTAAHAWSYGLTTNFSIPHGHAVWLTLPKIFKIHYERSRNTDLKITKLMDDIIEILKLDKNKCLCEQLKFFLKQKNIEYDFHNLGISLQDRRKLSKLVNMERMENNPVTFSSVEIKYIFK